MELRGDLWCEKRNFNISVIASVFSTVEYRKGVISL